MVAPRDSKSRGFATAAVIVLFAVLLAGAVLVRVSGDVGTPAEQEAISSSAESEPQNDVFSGRLAAGHPAPEFALADLSGNPVRLSDFAGRPVLVNFWATWCGPCKVEMPIIEAAFQTHRQDGLAVLAIAVDDSADAVQRFFGELELTFQPLLDDGTGSRAYQVFGLPTSYFIAADGNIAAVHTGLLTEERIDAYLAQMQLGGQ
jgi:thiol-disulfide isomerase/thioredoxin